MLFMTFTWFYPRQQKGQLPTEITFVNNTLPGTKWYIISTDSFPVCLFFKLSICVTQSLYPRFLPGKELLNVVVHLRLVRTPADHHTSGNAHLPIIKMSSQLKCVQVSILKFGSPGPISPSPNVHCTGSNPRWFSLVGQYWNKEGKEKEAHCGVSIFSRWTHPSFRIGGKSWGFYIFKVYSPQFSLPAGWKRIFLSHRTPPEYCAYCTPLNIVHNCA